MGIDTYFLSENYKSGVGIVPYLMSCPGAIGNPFIHMRVGQVYYEVGELDKAAGELVRAYMAEGEEVFSDEEPKYLEYLKTKIIIN